MTSFETEAMAFGYATARPPVHPRILQAARESLIRYETAQRALDIGCGAGLSTHALQEWANECIGLEPVERMLRWSARVAPQARFLVGQAEAIPLQDHSVDLITAAGSLNYVDLQLFFPEAARVLKPAGTLLIYDFSPGRRFRHAVDLDEWFTLFLQRYPPPAAEGRILSPTLLAQFDSGFRIQSTQLCEIGIELTPSFYVDYLLTETNVAAALDNGIGLEDIRSWCETTLDPLWNGTPHEVLFDGYFVCMTTTL